MYATNSSRSKVCTLPVMRAVLRLGLMVNLLCEIAATEGNSLVLAGPHVHQSVNNSFDGVPFHFGESWRRPATIQCFVVLHGGGIALGTAGVRFHDVHYGICHSDSFAVGGYMLE